MSGCGGGSASALGEGVMAPSVSLWLGEGGDPGPVSVVIFPGSIAIPFVDLTEHRSQAELARLATLARELPGVAPYLEDLEARDYGAGSACGVRQSSARTRHSTPGSARYLTRRARNSQFINATAEP